MNDQEFARSRMRSLDAGTAQASRWRSFRRFVVFVAMLAGLLEFGGVPSLRWTYEKVRDRVVVAEYIGPFGARRASAGELGGTCPLIALIPLERSLLSYAAEISKTEH